MFKNSNQPLTFSELLDQNVQQLHGKPVEIRGFLYKNDRKEWILAAEPNLKTCCIKTHQQLVIDDKTSSLPQETPSTAITLQGTFFIAHNTSYHLQNPLIVPSSSHALFFSVILIAIVLFTVLWIAKSFRFTSK